MKTQEDSARRRFLADVSLLPLLLLRVPGARAASNARDPLGSPQNAFGPQSTAEDVTAGLDLRGRTMLLTGCSSGIGLETLRVLVLRGAHVYGLAPTLEKAQNACNAAMGTGIAGQATPMGCNHVDFADIVRCTDAIQKQGTPLDALICNAGINLQRLEQVNGIEKDFVVNHLAHFIQVNRLLNLVKRAPQGRIVVVGSGAYELAKSGIEFDNLSGERDYDFLRMYAQSKLANGLFARELARRLCGTAVTSNLLNPGFVDTPMNRNLVGTFLPKDFDFSKAKTVAQGAATSCYLTTHPSLSTVSGAYFENCQLSTPKGYLLDNAMATKLWTMSEQLTQPYLGYQSPR